MPPQLLDPRPYFANLPDPRRETRTKLHKLHDILMIVLCAVLSGVEDWVGMEAFAEEKETWLRGFLELPHGIPSHDTLSAGRARWVLAQQAVAEKSNEITAIPDLLGLLDLRGAVVSIDAMGGQNAIAQTLVEAGADDVLALKENHPTWCEDARIWLDAEVEHGHLPVLETVKKDHGRIELRRYALSSQIDGLEAQLDWAGLRAVGRVESARIIGETTSTECRYVLCSLAEQDRLAAPVRRHWGIENQPHGVLDVQFGEEACRTRTEKFTRRKPAGSRFQSRTGGVSLSHPGPFTASPAHPNAGQTFGSSPPGCGFPPVWAHPLPPRRGLSRRAPTGPTA